MRKIGIKQIIEEEQFLSLNPKTQELLFNMLYCEEKNATGCPGIYFKGLSVDILDLNMVDAMYMNGDDYSFPIYLHDVCKNITIGSLIEAVSGFGTLELTVNDYISDEKANSKGRFSSYYYDGGYEFDSKNAEVIDVLLGLLDSICIKKFT